MSPHYPSVRREPLLLPCAALAGGILIAHLSHFELADIAFPAAFSCALLAACLLIPSAKRVRLAPASLVLLLAGLTTEAEHRQTRIPKLDAEDGQLVLLEGCITNPPVFSPAREQFTVNLNSRAAIRVTVMLKRPQPPLALRYGQRAQLAAKVHVPRNFQNPDSFDYAGYMAAQNIYWTGSVSSPGDIQVLPGSCGWKPLSWLYGVRGWALQRLQALYPEDPHTSGLLQATLLGETAAVDRRWTSDFRVTGTYHALVISGQHVSVLAVTLLFLFRLIRLRRIPALAVSTLVCWLYAFISGFSSPVVRAAGGFTLFLAATCVFRRTRILNVLAAIGIVYLAFAPDQLFDPSFQLSFLSAAAIAAFAIPLMERVTEPLRDAVKRFDQVRYDPQIEVPAAQWRVEFRLLAETVHLWTGVSIAKARLFVAGGVLTIAFVLDTVLVSGCVQFGLALPMVTYFHRLSVTGLSANIIVIPLLSLVVPLGFATILTGWPLLAAITRLLLLAAEAVAGWHVRFEPVWRIAAIPLSVSLCFAAALILLGVAVRHCRALVYPLTAASLALFVIICWQPWNPITHPGMLEVTAIDVSQGDSLLVVFPNGKTMLVDAGGIPGAERMQRKPQIDMGEDVVSPYLWSRRIKRLDYALLTHGHSDHMGGLPAILDNFRPDALWIGAEPPTPEWENVRQHAITDHVRIIPLNRSARPASIAGVGIRVLAPAPDYVAGEDAQNNDSLVIELAYGSRRVLLTGDAERPVEDDMLLSGQLHPVTLLKVGHHGSKTSSSEAFLDQVQPQFAFISDGYMNQFHHPHREVLERLVEHHTAVFRTDQRGLSTFLTDGNNVQIETYR